MVRQDAAPARCRHRYGPVASPRRTRADPLGAGARRRGRQGAAGLSVHRPRCRTHGNPGLVRSALEDEVTFAEVRRHLGVETQRQWSDLAILRTTPALLGLFSLVTLWADRIKGEHG